MREISIRLTSLQDVKAFVDASIENLCDVEVLNGEQEIDARSIKDVLSLNLKQPLRVVLLGAKAEVDAFCRCVSNMIVA